MFNAGLSELRLVAPREKFPSKIADATSADCLKLMDEVKVYKSLSDATADINYIYALSARQRQMEVKSSSLEKFGERVAKKYFGKIKTAIVFGGESSGLNNDDISRCNEVITIVLNPKFNSLNLSQAVLLVSWNFWIASQNTKFEKIKRDNLPAAAGHVNGALNRLETELEIRGFFKSNASGEIVKRNIRTMFSRINMNEQEVQCLHGMVRCLLNFPIIKK